MEGNQMKMREALVKVLRLANVTADGENWDWNNAIAENVVKVVKEALAAPPRNCDVGTAEEQTKRFSDFCEAYRHTDLLGCAGCPLKNTPSDTGCSFAWAQMPYESEEGGAK
jgi:hypothetical protein